MNINLTDKEADLISIAISFMTSHDFELQKFFAMKPNAAACRRMVKFFEARRTDFAKLHVRIIQFRVDNAETVNGKKRIVHGLSGSRKKGSKVQR